MKITKHSAYKEYNRSDDMEDILEIVYSGDAYALLDNLVRAMSDDAAKENFDYIKRMNDYDGIKTEMGE